MRVVHAEHGVVAPDGEFLVLGARAGDLLRRNLLDREGRDAGGAVVGPVVTGPAGERPLALQDLGPPRPVVAPVQAAVQLAERGADPVGLGLDEGDPEVGEALEDPAQDHLPQGPARVEGVLERQRHDGGETGRAVGRSAGPAVLADGQVGVDAGGPDRIEGGVEEEGATGQQGRHHDAAQPVLAGPVDVPHGLVHVVERDERLTGPATRRLGAEVGQPPVVGHPGLPVELGPAEVAVVPRSRLEGKAVGEQHLGHDPLALHVLQAELGVPLRRGIEPRLDAPRQRRPLLRPDPLVEDGEVPLLHVVPVGLS